MTMTPTMWKGLVVLAVGILLVVALFWGAEQFGGWLGRVVGGQSLHAPIQHGGNLPLPSAHGCSLFQRKIHACGNGGW